MRNFCEKNTVSWMKHPAFGAASLRLAFSLVVLMFLVTSQPVQALERPQIVATPQKGFARILLTFEGDEVPKYKVNITSSVMVLSFDERIETDLTNVFNKVGDYISAVRLDPDGKALRFALARKIKFNAIEAGEKLFLDIMPSNWVGLPPSLPAKIVAALARRAKDAERAALEKMRRKEMEAQNLKLRVRTGELPTFSRLVFDWKKYVGVKLTRDGKNISVIFDHLAKPLIAELKATPPRFIVKADASIEKENLVFKLELQPGVNVRGFRDGPKYVLDVLGPAGVSKGEILIRPVGEKGESLKGKKDVMVLKDESQKTQILRDQEEKAKIEAGQKKEIKPDVPAIALREKSMQQTAPATVSMTEKQGSLESQMVDKGPADQNQADTKKTKTKIAPTKAKAVKSKTNAKDMSVRMSLIGNSARITVPFTRSTAATVFMRGDVLWAAFDTDEKIDEASLKKIRGEIIKDVTKTDFGNLQLLRFSLSSPFLASASGKGHNWVLTLGDLVVDPTRPLPLKRGLQKDGGARIVVDVKGAQNVHWIKDPESKGKLALVTMRAPARGLIKPQKFVEFTAWTTSHGLAISPNADDLDVSLGLDRVAISRAGGLTLSAGGATQYKPGRKSLKAPSSSAQIKFAEWKGDPNTLHLKKEQEFEQKISALPRAKSISSRLELARFYLANGLSAEALGVLRIMAHIDPDIEKDPVFNASRAVANLLMGRPEAADKDLAVHGLSQDRHAEIWRSLMEAQKGNWRQALRHFVIAEPELRHYPHEVQAVVRMAAAKAALNVKNLPVAEFNVAILKRLKLSAPLEATVSLLEGRLLQALGRDEKAMALYVKALESRDMKAEAEAGYRKVALQLARKKISTDDAIDDLEKLALSWRGDDTELKVLRALAKLHNKEKNYRRALEVMRTAVKNYPRKDISSLINDDMRILFQKLYLKGEADRLPVVEALGIYYDFRELTPVGRKGDEMIRQLAERLMSVDLLSQASELLEHQVDKRLKGAARAQVAARLAVIQLMNHKPNHALRTLRRTRQAILPKALTDQRRLLEARSLTEIGRTKQAIELIANMEGKDAALMRAEAYWRGNDWQSAGEAYERVLGAVWQGKKPLDQNAQVNAMRAAIAYALADDRLGLQRFRTKYAPKMTKSASAGAFEVVTSEVDPESTEFRNLAKDIASINTLESFLSDFRQNMNKTWESSKTEDGNSDNKS